MTTVWSPDLYPRRRPKQYTPEREKFLQENPTVDTAMLADALGVTEVRDLLSAQTWNQEADRESAEVAAMMLVLFQIYGSFFVATMVFIAMVYWKNRKMTMPESKPYACGRVHLGPVINVQHLSAATPLYIGQRCTSCGNGLTETELAAYWKTKHSAMECRDLALRGARTK